MPLIRYVISQHMTSEQYSGMYRSSDAYVIPTRGEGWGMPITEVGVVGVMGERCSLTAMGVTGWPRLMGVTGWPRV